MKGYGQFCPVAKAAEIVGERWTPLVLRELVAGSHRFNDLRNGLPLMSPALLAKRLKTLERAGVIERRNGSNRRVEYHLTAAGQDLGPLIMQLGVWGQRWVRSDLGPEDLDPALLMWDLHRRVRTGCFPPQRTVVQFELTDAAKKYRQWWLVVQGGETELCLKDPGHEVNLYVQSDTRTLAAIWMGEDTVSAARSGGRLKLHGDRALRDSMQTWLGLSVFAIQGGG